MGQDFKKAPSKVWLFVGLQWATTLLSFALAWQRWPVAREAQTPSLALAAIALGLAALVTFRWLHQGGWRRPLSSVELIIMTAAPVALVAASNWWQSPYVFLLLNSVVVAAYTIGFATTLLLSLFASLMISVPYLFLGVDATGMTDQARIADSLRWSALLVFIGVTSGYAVRLSNKENGGDQLNIARREEVKKLQEANKLLFELHRVAQDLPVSLDAEDVATSSLSQLSTLIEFSDGAILLKQDPAPFANALPEGPRWRVVVSKGSPGRVGELPEHLLPESLSESIKRKKTVARRKLGRGKGLGVDAKNGLYAPVLLRDETVAVVVLENKSDTAFNDNDVEIVNNFCSALALGLDNANWFSRLRTMGAEEERNRIARELHDSIGQSLMYLGLSADNLISSAGPDSPLSEPMQEFRDDVREAITEMRDTLYDLRTGITPDHDLPKLLREYSERVQRRSGIDVTINDSHTRRLPVLQEKEMWRIAQEAIVNAEKYSECQHINVTWECQDGTAKLVVEDDGIGFRIGTDGRRDSYGLLGIRERAQSIGADLSIESQPGQGCRITCTLNGRG